MPACGQALGTLQHRVRGYVAVMTRERTTTKERIARINESLTQIDYNRSIRLAHSCANSCAPALRRFNRS